MLATLLAVGSLGFTFANSAQTITTVEAVRFLCEDGAPGSDGQDGLDGTDGEDGAQGPVGLTGPQGPAGADGITQLADYGSFYSDPTISQLPAAEPQPMLAPFSAGARGVSVHSAGSISVTSAGMYNIQFSAQFEKDKTKPTDRIDIWLQKKATGDSTFANVPVTNTEIDMVEKNARLVAGWNFMIPIQVGDEVRIMWYSDLKHTSLVGSDAKVDPARPAVPPVILTVQQIGLCPCD